MPTYYFSSSAGNDSRTSTQAQNSATPWQSISKHNSTVFAAGDVVSFARGDVFFGALVPGGSGSSGNVITYTSHGNGAEPLITGLSTLTSWTATGNARIYYAAVDVPRLNIVIIDGVLKGMGRYPNSSYLQYTDHVVNVISVLNFAALPSKTVGVDGPDWNLYLAQDSGIKYRWNGASYSAFTYPFGVGTQGVFGATVASLPFDPTDYEGVVRKDRYYVDRQKIIARSGSWLNVGRDTNWGNNDQNATNNNGFFIQGGLSCLDTDGDWFYDSVLKRLYVYFSGTPTGRVVQASLFASGMNLSSMAYLTMNNIKISGYNSNGIDTSYGGHFNISTCIMDYIGGNAIEGINGAGFITIHANNMSKCHNGAVNFYNVDNVTVTDNIVDTINPIQGMGKSGDAAGNGLHFYGNNQTVTGNRVTNCGFNGISFFAGNNLLVENNFVRRFCLLKDDGGGVYMYGITTQTFTNRSIHKNVVLDGIGSNNVGADGLGSYIGDIEFGLVYSVYLDNFTSQVSVDNNVLFSSTAGGVFVNLSGDNDITNNVIYDGKYCIAIASNGGVTSMNVSNNKVIAKTADQMCMFLVRYGNEADIVNYGTFDNNLYSRPAFEGATIRTSNGSSITDRTVAQWKTAFGKDAASTASLVTTGSVSNIRSDYNYGPSPLTLSLGAVYKSVTNVLLNGSEVLPAFGGSVKIWQSALVGGGVKIRTNPAGKILFNPNNNKILTTI
jgi:hypothetical protein